MQPSSGRAETVRRGHAQRVPDQVQEVQGVQSPKSGRHAVVRHAAGNRLASRPASQVLPAPGSPVIRTGPAGPFSTAARNRSSARRRLATARGQSSPRGCSARVRSPGPDLAPSLTPLPSRSRRHIKSCQSVPWDRTTATRCGSHANVDVCMAIWQRQKRIPRDYFVNHRWPGGLILNSVSIGDQPVCWREDNDGSCSGFSGFGRMLLM